MADNVTLNVGVGGDVAAADDIGGVKYQRLKITLGDDGVNDGDVSSANPMPVSAAALPLPSGAATDTLQTAGNASLATIAGAVSGTEIQVDVLTMPAVTVQDGGGSVTVDGTVAATQSGTWTVQPGNTPNTTAWKVDGSAVTQPISAASLPLPSGASAKVAMSVTGLQVTASGDTTLVASGTRKLKRVEASNSHASTALTAGLKVASLNSGAVFGKKYLPAAGGLAVWVFPDDYLQITSEAIVANLSAAGQVEFTAYYE